jgi:N-acetylmuramoyl-L-alanine amidase
MIELMLDAGHGLNTAGKRSIDGSLHEWSFNSVVAKYTADLLAQYENVKTYFAHDVTGARDVPLQERTDTANKLGVDAYISFHANAGPTTARGLETFVFPKCPQSTIALGNAIHNSLIKTLGVTNRGLKRADFHVLRETDMDAALIEHSFMTNAQDLKLLKDDDFRHKCAQGTVDALVAFYGLKKKQVAPIPQPTQQAAPGPEIRYIYTGGYGGPALLGIHNYLIKTGHGYDVKRGPDGSIIFLIGPFDTSQPNWKECYDSVIKLDSHMHLLTREQAAEWRK